MHVFLMYLIVISIFMGLKMLFFSLCVYYYDYLYVFYMLDIVQRAFELMFPVYRYTNENK